MKFKGVGKIFMGRGSFLSDEQLEAMGGGGIRAYPSPLEKFEMLMLERTILLHSTRDVFSVRKQVLKLQWHHLSQLA